MFSEKILIPVLVALLVIFIYSLWQRPPDIDDAWIGADAYSLAKDGYVHTDLMRGINMQEQRSVVHHKLFNLHGAIFIKIFDFSLYTLKTVSLLYLFIFLLLFYYYTMNWKRLFTREEFLFALILLFTFPWIFKYAFVYRPEIMMMTFGFAGFILLERFIESAKPMYVWLVISGFFFGLATAAHLNGLIFITSAIILLLWDRKLLSAFMVGIGAAMAFLIYFYDYTDTSYFELWQLQFFNNPSLDSIREGSWWYKPVLNFIWEHIRYFHNFQVIVFSVFFLFTLAVGYKYLFRNYQTISRFAMLMAMMTGILAMHKSQQYLLLNYPYLVILIILTIKALKNGHIRNFRFGNLQIVMTTISIALLFFLLASSYFNIRISFKKFSSEMHRDIAMKYADGNERSMNIVAPMPFFFNEVENFKSIQSDLVYIQLQKSDSSIYGTGFLKKAESFDIDLILVEPEHQRKLGMEHFEIGNESGSYKVIDKTDHSLVLKRRR